MAGTTSTAEARRWVSVLAELRRPPTMGYKSDSVVISGLDEDDKKLLSLVFSKLSAPSDSSAVVDPDDPRMVLKGPACGPMEVINTLTVHRGYRVEFNPQQHSIPLKQGNFDDKFAMIYHLSKATKLALVTSMASSNASSVTSP